MPRIDLSPMLDIAVLLLIFVVLVLAARQERTSRFDPEMLHQSYSENGNLEIKMRIKKNGEIYIDGAPATFGSIAVVLSQRVSTAKLGQEIDLVLFIPDSMKMGEYAKLQDSIRQTGIERIHAAPTVE